MTYVRRTAIILCSSLLVLNITCGAFGLTWTDQLPQTPAIDVYYDFRPTIHIAAEEVLPIDGAFGFHPHMGPIKRLWDEGKVAVINGIGYPHPDRSHFRSMDIWHTAEPETIGKEGWLGRAIRALDPKGDNVLTGINFGRGLPRALGPF